MKAGTPVGTTTTATVVCAGASTKVTKEGGGASHVTVAVGIEAGTSAGTVSSVGANTAFGDTTS